ncbi:MAG: oligosaccharide flippase family protein [Planctomycetota bacterium]
MKKIAVRSLVRNYCVLVFGEVVARSLTFVTLAYLARKLGPGDFGVIEFCFAHALILYFMVDFGVGVLGPREIAQRPDEIKGITQQMASIRFWSMVSSLLLLVCYVMLSPQPWAVKSLLLLFGVSLVPVPYQFQWVFLGRNLMHYVSISQMVRFGVFAGIVLPTVRDASGMWIVAAAELAGLLAAAIFSVICLRLKMGFWPLSLPVVPAWSVIRQVVPIALSHFMWLAKYVFATVIVGFLTGLGKDAEEVGHFGAAVRIIVTMHVFVSLYFRNLLPSVSHAATKSVEPLQVLLDHTIRASAWVSLCGATLLVIMAHQVIQVVYGDEYGQSVLILKILVWMLPAALVSVHFQVTLIATSRQGLELFSTAAGAATTLTLIMVLFHRFGLASVAVAMVIGEMITLVVSFVFTRLYVLRVRLGRCIWPPVVTTIATAALLLAWPSAALWTQALIMVVFFALAIAVFDRESLGILRKIIPSSTRRAADLV